MAAAVDRRTWLLAATATASLSSFLLSLVAARRLSLAEFGVFSLIVTSGFLLAATLRASIGEVDFDRTTGDGGLTRSRIRLSIWIGAPIAVVVLAPQFLLLSIDAAIFLPATAFSLTLSVADVGRVRLVSLGAFGSSAVAELLRIVALSAILLSGVSSTRGLLLAGSAATLPVITLGYQPRGDSGARPRLKSAATAALDVLVQRGAGQLASSIVFASSAATVGAIAAARLGFAPLTTLYTAASGFALAGSVVSRRYVVKLVAFFVAVGVAYLLSVLVVLSWSDEVLRILSPERFVTLRSLMLPVGLFALSGAVAPVVSTSLRRIGQPAASLGARTIGSLALLVGVATVSVTRSAEPVAVAWAYAGAGLVGAASWMRVVRILDTRAEVASAE